MLLQLSLFRCMHLNRAYIYIYNYVKKAIHFCNLCAIILFPMKWCYCNWVYSDACIWTVHTYIYMGMGLTKTHFSTVWESVTYVGKPIYIYILTRILMCLKRNFSLYFMRNLGLPTEISKSLLTGKILLVLRTKVPKINWEILLKKKNEIILTKSNCFFCIQMRM